MYINMLVYNLAGYNL